MPAAPGMCRGGASVLLAWLCLGLLSSAARAATVLDFPSGPRNVEVPDASLEGVFDTLSIATSLNQVSDLQVSVNLDPGAGGAFAGDLYLTLVHENRVAVLLNRPGKEASHPLGYADAAGFQVTFSDTASAGDIHRYHEGLSPGQLASSSAPLEGRWRPDGRLLDPRFVSEADSQTAMLSQFDGLDPNGPWTLFLADLSGGGEVRLRDWSLHFGLATVPDVDPSLVLLLLACGATGFARRHGRRPSAHP